MFTISLFEIVKAGRNMSIKNILWTIFKGLSYASLFLVSIGAAALFFPFILDLCQNKSGGVIACTTPFIRTIYEFGFTVTLMSIYTGFPLFLALAGFVFAIRRLFR
jgi:hypothetical protein